MTDVKIKIADEYVDINTLPSDGKVLLPYTESEYEQIKEHFKGFINYRKASNNWITDTDKIRNLPYSVTSRTWLNKVKSLSLINRKIGARKTLDILIVGSGNGWLANQLALKSHSVLGIDILYYEYDGLQTISRYKSFFRHLLLHPHDLEKLQGSFDVIIFENNLPYIQSVFGVIKKAKRLLKKDGKIICTAINVNQNASKESERIKSLVAYFKTEWKHHINTYNTKMYFDRQDIKSLKGLGFKINIRRGFRNLINYVLSRKVVTFDGTFNQI